MAFIEVPNVAQVNVRMGAFGQRIENTLYFDHSGAISQEQLDDLCEYVAEWWYVKYRPLVTAEVSLLEVYGVDLTADDGIVSTSLLHAGAIGTTAGNAVPLNAAFCVTFVTSARGRSGRGRNYISGLSEAIVSGNALDATAATNMVAAYQDLIDTPATGWIWSVVSRYEDGAARDPGIAREILNVKYTDLFIDSQRRRLTGRGS